MKSLSSLCKICCESDDNGCEHASAYASEFCGERSIYNLIIYTQTSKKLLIQMRIVRFGDKHDSVVVGLVFIVFFWNAINVLLMLIILNSYCDEVSM